MTVVRNVEEDDNEDQGMNVLGENNQPNQQPQQAPQVQNPVNVSGGPSTAIGQGATPQTQKQPDSSKSKGSGMFTNVQKYAKANQNASQNLSGAVQKNVQQQVKGVNEQLQQQQKTYQQRVAEQRARAQQAQTFAQEQLQAASTTGQAAEAEDVRRFQNLQSGQERYDNAGQLGAAQQDLAAQQLARKAAVAERASTTSGLLRDTFGNNRYTRGQQSLDSLILGTDKNARKDLTQSVQDTSQGLTQNVRDARQQALAQAANLSQDQRQFQDNLGQQLSGAREQVQTEVTQSLAEKQQAMQGQIDSMKNAFDTGQITQEQFQAFTTPEALEQAANKMEDMKQEMIYRLGGDDTMDFLGDQGLQDKYGDITREELRQARYGAPLTAKRNESVDRWLQRIQRAQDNREFGNSTSEITQSFGPAAVARKLLQAGIINKGQVQQALQRAQATEDQGLRVDNFEGQTFTQRRQSNELAKLIKGLDRFDSSYLTNAIQGDLAKRGASSSLFNEFVQTQDPTQLQRSDVMSEEQFARQNALAALAGQQGAGIQERTQRDFGPGTLDIAGLFRKLRGV